MFILFLIICLPILLGVAVVGFVFPIVFKGSKNDTYANIIKLNPGRHLLAQPVFWLSILIPFFYALASGFPVWIEYTIEISEAGYENFLRISKLPFAFAAISIPLGALVARAHGTAQAAAQLVEHERKNNFDLFYKHQEAFVEYLKKETTIPTIIDIDKEKIFAHLTLLYEKLFPDNSPLHAISLNCDYTVLYKIREGLLSAHQQLIEISKADDINKVASGYVNLNSRMMGVMGGLSLSNVYNELRSAGMFRIKQTIGGNVVEFTNSYIDCSLADWLKYINFCHQVFGLLCKFCHVSADAHTFSSNELADSERLKNADRSNKQWIDFQSRAKVNMGDYSISGS